MRWQKDFQELEKLLGSYIGTGSSRKCPRQFWLLTSHPLSIPLTGTFRKRLCWRASAQGHKSPAKTSAPRAIGVSKTVAFESEKGGKAAIRGNKQLLQDFEQSIEVRKPKALLEEDSAGGCALQGLLFCLFLAFKNVTVV